MALSIRFVTAALEFFAVARHHNILSLGHTAE